MAKMMTEKEVLDALGIEDFRHMSKDKVITAFSSMLPNMSPEVALKILEQFPSFSQAMTDIATEYKEVLCKSVDSANETTQQCIAVCQTIIDTLCKELEKDDVSFEEKKYYIEQMQQIGQLIKEIKEDHNKFMLKCIGYGLFALTTLAAIMVAALGGDIQIPMPKKTIRN